MKRAPRIELPDKRADELPLRSLIATSMACVIAGFSVAYAITDRGVEDKPAAAATELAPDLELTPPPSQEPIAEQKPVAEQDPVAPQEPVAGQEPPAAPDAVPLSEATIAVLEAALGAPDAAIAVEAPYGPPAPPEIVAEPAPAEVAATAAEPAARRLRVDPGFFAYLRCEGLRQRKGRYPCPRDRALEERMREIVEALPTCREAHAISRGMFDVRLELGADGAVTDLHVKAPNEGAERAVRACAAAGFRKAQTKLRPKRMIVSMRWRAR